MKHVTIKVCTFDELSDDAKERARDWYRQGGCFHWRDEWWQSAREFSAIAPVDIFRVDIACAHVDVSWHADENVRGLSGVRAWKWLQNNGWFELARRNAQGDCTLTGFCGDCPLFDPLVKYAETPGQVPGLEQVFYECAQSWVSEAQRDYDWCNSDEAIDDNIICNAYEFTEQGEFWA
jgi:hypothetical protein